MYSKSVTFHTDFWPFLSFDSKLWWIWDFGQNTGVPQFMVSCQYQKDIYFWKKSYLEADISLYINMLQFTVKIYLFEMFTWGFIAW